MISSPVPNSFLELQRTMPRCEGKIVDPRYVPERLQESYLREWGEWLRATPRQKWELWMHNLVNHMKSRAKNTSRGQSLIESFEKLTRPTAPIGTFASHAAVDD